jgi:hypothetical protein
MDMFAPAPFQLRGKQAYGKTLKLQLMFHHRHGPPP